MSYPNISRTTARARLATARAQAAKYSAMPHNVASGTVYNWKDCRKPLAPLSHYGAPGNWEPTMTGDKAQYAGRRGLKYHAGHIDGLPGRHTGAAPDVHSDIDHLGWFTDDHQDGKIVGHVMQLPGKDGQPRYYPAIAWTDADMVIGWPFEIHDNAADAARSADGEAEQAAERDREADEEFRAAELIELARDDIASARQKHTKLARDLHTLGRATLPPDLRETVHAAMAGHRHTVRQAIEVIRAGGAR